MKRAAADKDFETLRNLGHKLRGAGANLRFAILSDHFALIEEKAAARDVKFDFLQVIDNINTEIDRLKLLI